MGQKLKIDLFQLVRAQKVPQLIAFFLKINLLYPVIYIPHYIPQHYFRKKKNPNYL